MEMGNHYKAAPSQERWVLNVYQHTAGLMSPSVMLSGQAECGHKPVGGTQVCD